MMSSLNAEYTLSLRVAGTVLIRCGCDKEERVRDRIRCPLPRLAAFGKNSSSKHSLFPRVAAMSTNTIVSKEQEPLHPFVLFAADRIQSVCP
jgi:hypothetical protein